MSVAQSEAFAQKHIVFTAFQADDGEVHTVAYVYLAHQWQDTIKRIVTDASSGRIHWFHAACLRKQVLRARERAHG